ncbi:MAG: hypothetical protein AABW65_02170 [Nanoarchaeota archaeon]
MKKIENIIKASGLSSDYLIALGSVEHYLKRVEQMHKENLPSRWMHLAERTLQQRPIKRYEGYFNSEESEDNVVNDENRENVNTVNGLVYKINLLWEDSDAAQKMRKPGSSECEKMAEYYLMIKKIVLYGKNN